MRDITQQEDVDEAACFLFCYTESTLGLQAVTNVCHTGKDKTALPQQLNNLAQARHHAGRRTQEEEEAHSTAQHSSTGGSAMRAMHDSSSSWTDRSLPATTSAAAKQQADVACLPTPHAQVEHVQPVPLKPVPEGAMDMQGADSEAACVGQAASVVPAPGPVATAPLNGTSLVTLPLLTVSEHLQ